MRKKPVKSKPIYPIDFSNRVQLVRGGHTYVRYGVPSDGSLPKHYGSSGRVPLYGLQPPSETEHFDLGLQGKL
jgi:hypothetical protein